MVGDDEVDLETSNLQDNANCRSDDAHVLALAKVSGARLLFTNDQALQNDFGNRGIVSGTRGKVYTTLKHQEIRRSHRDLLRRTDLCNP